MKSSSIDASSMYQEASSFSTSYSKSFDTFIDNFQLNLEEVTQENADDVNKYLNVSYSDKMAVCITVENLETIKHMAFTIQKLKEKGITSSKTYRNKVRDYDNFRRKALKNYGIILPNKVPISDPTQLHIKIDVELSKAKFNKEQKNEFFNLFSLRKHNPAQTNIDNKLDSIKFSKLLEAYNTSLTHEEQIAIIQKDIAFNFSHNYYSILEEFDIDEFPNEVVYYDSSPSEVEILELEIEKLDYDYKKEKIHLEHLFLEYPSYLIKVPQFIKKQDISFVAYALQTYILSGFTSLYIRLKERLDKN